MKVQLGKVLQRELSGKKLKDVAEETGIPISLLGDWKHGALPSGKNIEKLQVLAEYFEISLSELVFNQKDQDAEATILQSVRFKDGRKEYKITIERLK